MHQEFPSFLIPGDEHHSEQQYRIVDRNVQFSRDGVHWRTLSAEDVDLHLRLQTPVAVWIEANLIPLRGHLPSRAFSGPERRRNVIWTPKAG
jgi:hypothetical protein